MYFVMHIAHMNIINKGETMRHRIAGVIFLALGTYFFMQDMLPDSMGAGAAMTTHHGVHSNTLLGLGEMTWMWFTMALVHFFIRDCNCKECNK
jgi:hypothetical protein